jgi:hypothetical protein
MEANLLHLYLLCLVGLFECLLQGKILLETEVTSTESSQHFTLPLEDHPVIQIILPFGSWNGGIYVSGKKVFVIAITMFAERRCKFKEVCSWYFSCSSRRASDFLDLFHLSRPSSFSPKSDCPSCSSTITILNHCKSHRGRELGGMSNECCYLLRLLRKQWRVRSRLHWMR